MRNFLYLVSITIISGISPAFGFQSTVNVSSHRTSHDMIVLEGDINQDIFFSIYRSEEISIGFSLIDYSIQMHMAGTALPGNIASGPSLTWPSFDRIHDSVISQYPSEDGTDDDDDFTPPAPYEIRAFISSRLTWIELRPIGYKTRVWKNTVYFSGPPDAAMDILLSGKERTYHSQPGFDSGVLAGYAHSNELRDDISDNYLPNYLLDQDNSQLESGQ